MRNIYIWKTKLSPHKQYLFGLTFFKNTKKIHTDQCIPQFFYSVRNKTTYKTLQVPAGKNSFLDVYH